MIEPITGRVFRFGDNINSDVIIAGRYLIYIEPEKLAEHAFEVLGSEYPAKLQGFDILVAGRNFGCGSAREQAATALIGLGIRAVVATSFARTFYRNALNSGLPIIECPELVEATEEGDEITIDLAGGTAVRGGETYTFGKFPPSLQALLEAGGLASYLEKTLQRSSTES